MERWRWYPDSFGDRYLMVNIPAFALTIVDTPDRIDNIRVIVGKKNRQTPIMSDRMTYIEFNPYWNIPQNIARKDILPKVIHDPSYLSRQGIRVFDSWDRSAQELDPTTIDWGNLSARYFPYRLRQDPSQRNALGQIKFIFPNPLSIYIHDTPGKSLFNCQERAFSSGCVRLEEPITLATHLLGDQGWNRHRLETLTAHEKAQSVVLTTPIPVHLVYFTAWVDGDKTVNFRKDIYGHDARLVQALNHPGPDHRL
jgi:murein L,D-transpeptidase YcbB/YkuD